jgi:prevent-host-death family protein
METMIGITEIRESLGSVVDDVQYQNRKYIISRHGKPAAAVVPLYVYDDWKRNRERLFELISQAQEASGDHDPDEIMALVLEAQQAVRVEI